MRFSEQIPILCVDDDEIDRRNLKRSMTKAGMKNPFLEAEDGVEALELLRSEGRVPRPCILILDLNMPRMNGLEFLHEVRSDAELRDLIIFVHTTSTDNADVAAAYQKQVAGYLTKPVDATGLSAALEDLHEMWKRLLLPDPVTVP